MTTDELHELRTLRELIVHMREEQHEMGIELERVDAILHHLVKIITEKQHDPEQMK